MAIPRKGSRKITVDQIEYRWNIRRKPTYDQDIWGTATTISVELVSDHPGSVLVVKLPQAHPSAAVRGQLQTAPVLPSQVVRAVQQAIAQGWQPNTAGKPFCIDLA